MSGMPADPPPDSRADALVRRLGLSPHPEGGAYREIFRSPQPVRPGDGRPERSALTVIYFLLRAGEQSAWHRVASDEAWLWLEGDPLELLEADELGGETRRRCIGRTDDGREPAHVVPAGVWQAARTTGSYSLVSCAVGPGFDFADFEMAPDRAIP
jgi:uncharacterized protein